MSNLQTLSSQKLPIGIAGVEFRLGNRVRVYTSTEVRLNQVSKLHSTGSPFNIFALGFKFSAKVVVTYLQPFSLDTRFCGYADLVLLSPIKSY